MEKIFSLRTVGTAVGLCIGSISLFGCGDKEAQFFDGKPATVVSHEYDDPDPGFIIIGKVPIFFTYPEHYYLNVDQCGHDELRDQNPNGCGLFTVEVDQETYDQHPDGSTILLAKS